jgi:hypothetical protein
MAFILFSASSCKTQASISRGTSFGHCRGFCNKELTVGKTEISFRQWENGELPQSKILTAAPISKDSYNQVTKGFDFRAFYAMDSTIGCPDCADGGAEWIEVRQGSKRKRVTYEYKKVPESLKATVEQMIKLQARMDTDAR